MAQECTSSIGQGTYRRRCCLRTPWGILVFLVAPTSQLGLARSRSHRTSCRGRLHFPPSLPDMSTTARPLRRRRTGALLYQFEPNLCTCNSCKRIVTLAHPLAVGDMVVPHGVTRRAAPAPLSECAYGGTSPCCQKLLRDVHPLTNRLETVSPVLMLALAIDGSQTPAFLSV